MDLLAGFCYKHRAYPSVRLPFPMNPPPLARRFRLRSHPRHRRLAALGACLGLGAAASTALLPTSVWAQNNLVVQGPNSPYTFTTTASYDNVYVGQSANGTLNHLAGVLNVTTGQLFVGANAGVTGVYNLSGGTLNTISSDVGDSGTGTFTLANGAVHNVTGTDNTANGSLDIGYYSGGTGTYNLNVGTLTAGYVRGNQGARAPLTSTAAR